jgi:hypothetical protein
VAEGIVFPDAKMFVYARNHARNISVAIGDADRWRQNPTYTDASLVLPLRSAQSYADSGKIASVQ